MTLPSRAALALPEADALLKIVEAQRPTSHPLFIELSAPPGGGKTTILKETLGRLHASGRRALMLTAIPGRGSEARILEELRGAAGEITGGAEGAILIDDAQHAAAPLLLEALAVLSAAAKASRHPQFLVGAAEQPVELPLTHPGEVATRRVTVAPLPETTLQEILMGHGLGRELASRAAAALHAHEHPTPRAAALLAEALAEDPDASRPAIDRLLASGMKLLTARRFWQQPDASRRILVAAALLGSGVNHWRLERLHDGYQRADGAATTLDLESHGWLGRAHDAGFLRFVLRAARDREVLAEILSVDERRDLHRRIAAMLASDPHATVDLRSEVGRHQVLAGDVAEGARTLVQVGRQLVSAHRTTDARAHFEEVARLAMESGLGRERLLAMEGLNDARIAEANPGEVSRAYLTILEEGGAHLEPEDRVRLQRKRARRALEDGVMDDAAAILAAGRADLAPAMKVETALYFELDARIAMARGDYARAAGAAQDALTLATELGDERLLARFYATLARLCLDRGDYAIALQQIQSAAEIFERAGDTAGLLRAWMLRGNVHARTARYDDAEQCYVTSRRLAESINDADGMTTALMNLATLQVRADDLDLAEENLRHCQRIYRRTGSKSGTLSTLLNLGAISLQRGDCERALACATEGVALARETGYVLPLLHGKNAMISALVYLGRLKEALSMASDLAQEARASGVTSALAHAIHSEGFCRYLIGDFDTAEARFDEAFRIARDHQFANEAWDNLNERVEVLIARGDHAGAREVLIEERALINHAFQERETTMQEIFLRRLKSGDRGLGSHDRATLEKLVSERDRDVQARASLLFSRCTSGAEALGHAERAHALFKELGYREWIWRSAARIAALQEEMGQSAALRRYEEAAGIILQMAAGLDVHEREIYLRAFGRNDVLQKAFGGKG
ncbi:MAG: tetratricopeptide repeat protein [Acidobacteriota bacterium]